MGFPKEASGGNELKSLGLIMDGNRRWAREQGVSIIEGHRRGYQKLKEVLHWIREAGGTIVYLYAFSTENWHRRKTEVEAFLLLFKQFLKTGLAELIKENTRLIFIGRLADFPRSLQKQMAEAMTATAHCRKLTLVVAVSYGGRAEILAAARGFSGRTEEDFAKRLWTAGLPDPDLIIRTGGAQRLSNFLLWQAAYSEFYFTKTLWPALTQREFERIVADYRLHQRRFGR